MSLLKERLTADMSVLEFGAGYSKLFLMERVGRSRTACRADHPPAAPADDVTFVAAQSAARKWADKALDLDQAGDTERSRYARFRAEVWLVKMLALETRDGKPENNRPPIARPRAQRRSPPEERRDTKLNNATLRTWRRSPLCEEGD